MSVWVVRSAARDSMKSRPLVFADKELMLNYAKSFVKKKFGFDLDRILSQSLLLKEMRQQSKLGNFF